MHGNYTRHFDCLGWWIVFLYFPVYIYRHIFNLVAVRGEAACQEARRASRCAKHARVSPASLIGNYRLSTNNSPNPHSLVFCIATSDQFVHSSFMTHFLPEYITYPILLAEANDEENSLLYTIQRQPPPDWHFKRNLTCNFVFSYGSRVKYLKDYALPLWLIRRHPFIVNSC